MMEIILCVLLGIAGQALIYRILEIGFYDLPGVIMILLWVGIASMMGAFVHSIKEHIINKQ